MAGRADRIQVAGERTERIDPTKMPLFWGIRTFFRVPHITILPGR